ncbi:hypothetical protein RQP46_005968 [Phenoliferia psychrophenolica]
MGHKLLVANRGEIALRILRAASSLDIPTCSVFTETDAAAKHVMVADETVAVSSYTDHDAILAVCLFKGITLLHPGYGFLSENHAFATKVMLKSSGGGGGMGMSVCLTAADLQLAFERTVETAKSLFGDGGVFIEKYIPKARHIEIQIFGDGEGKVIDLGEREVEHAVTEQVRPGLDLVAMMITLGLSQAPGAPAFVLPPAARFSEAHGHAIEARIYSEIPHLAFKPAPGLLQQVVFPTDSWLRVDTWVETGVSISPFYGKDINFPLAEEGKFRAGEVTTAFLDTFEYTYPCIEFLDGGLATSVQDLRSRLTGDGIPRGGPMDELAFKAANILAGNEKTGTEGLEITMTGPTIRFTASAVVSVTGAQCDVYIDGVLKPMWSRLIVPAGGTLEIDACEGTVLRGGFPEIPLYLGSKSTFAAGQIGGVQGRDIVAGDIITLDPESAPTSRDVEFTLPPTYIPSYPQTWSLAALPGPHGDANYLGDDALETLFTSVYSVTADANHHGYTYGNLNMNGDTPILFSRDSPDLGGYWQAVTYGSWEHRDAQSQWLAACAAALKGQDGASDLTFPADAPPTSAPTPADGIIKRVAADATNCMPALTYRQSGDMGILVEVGDQRTSFSTRVVTELWERKLREVSPKGVHMSFGQGAASLMIRYDETTTTQAEVLAAFESASFGIGIAAQSFDIDCRRVHLPIVFDDSVTKAAIERYMKSSGRTEAVYLPSNASYLAEASGFAGIEPMLKAFESTDWFVSARAFFCGLPFLVPMDPQASLVSQKYNPSRTYTPAGTIGFAGATAAIYPIDSPGGYQLLGRTLTPWQPWADAYEDHFLLKSFDIVRWIPMEESAFDQVDKDFKAGKYEVKIENFTLSAKEMAAKELRELDAANARKQSNQLNMARLGEKEAKLFAAFQAKMEEAARADATSGKSSSGDQSGTPLKSPVHAVIRGFNIEVGATLEEGQEVARVEAMKTEIAIKVPRKLIGKVVRSTGEIGSMVKPGEALLYCD